MATLVNEGKPRWFSLIARAAPPQALLPFPGRQGDVSNESKPQMVSSHRPGAACHGLSPSADVSYERKSGETVAKAALAGLATWELCNAKMMTSAMNAAIRQANIRST